MTDNQNVGQKLDRLLSCIDGLEKRLSSVEKASADYDKRNRADARKRARADAEAKGKSYVPPLAGDRDDPDRTIDQPRQTAADATKDSEMNDLPEKIRRAREMRAELNALEREVSSEMRETAQGPMHEQEQEQIADAQARADSAYNELGRRAPPPMPGERLLQYRRRLLAPLKSHSKTWSDVDLSTQSGKNLDVIERQIFDDAIAFADSNDFANGDEMRVVNKTDDSGRRITEFRGRSSFINKFKGESRLATIRDPREFRLRELLQKGGL
jgi:hypothetical protein